jgi:[acyl-carrier-protein] S-malonyltransferase
LKLNETLLNILVNKTMKAYIFPGQGAQFPGMGKDLYDSSPLAQELFKKADEILGFSISEIMFHGSEEDLRQTKVTQPAVFIHSVIMAKMLGDQFQPNMTAGHSLGEFSALVASGAMSFEDGLMLVSARALAMQEACDMQPSTMAAILGLEDNVVDQVCQSITDEVVVAANFNCPGQVVISGSLKGVEIGCVKLTEAGAKRAVPLSVGGAFHSPLMAPAQAKLEAAIDATQITNPICPIYQNVVARAVSNPEEIKHNLKIQLTGAVRWTQSVQQMLQDGATEFYEVGPGKVLQGLVKKIDRSVVAESVIL